MRVILGPNAFCHRVTVTIKLYRIAELSKIDKKKIFSSKSIPVVYVIDTIFLGASAFNCFFLLFFCTYHANFRK